MNLNEYNEKIKEFADELSKLYDSDWNSVYTEMSEFQKKYMKNVLEKYSKTIDCKAKETIYELFSYTVNLSTSGNSIKYIEDKDLVNEIENIIWAEIGDYLLDYEIREEDNHWIIDCMFAGNYIPYWDGWKETE